MTVEYPITDLSIPIAMLLVIAFFTFFIYFASCCGHKSEDRIAIRYSSKTKPKTKPKHRTKPVYLDSHETEDESEDDLEEELDYPIIEDDF